MNYRPGGSFDLDPASGGSGVVDSVVAGDNVTIDATDPANPVVSASGGGGGGGVDSVVAGDNVTVDSTDPANPIVSAESGAPLPVDELQSWQNSVGGYGFGTGSLDSSDFVGVLVQTNDDGTGVTLGDVQTGPAIVLGTPGAEVFLLASGEASIGMSQDSGTVAVTSQGGPFIVTSGYPMKMPHSADPGTFYEASSYAGHMIYDDTLGIMLYSNGTAWIPIIVQIVAGSGINVDITDPANPVVSVAV